MTGCFLWYWWTGETSPPSWLPPAQGVQPAAEVEPSEQLEGSHPPQVQMLSCGRGTPQAAEIIISCSSLLWFPPLTKWHREEHHQAAHREGSLSAPQWQLNRATQGVLRWGKKGCPLPITLPAPQQGCCWPWTAEDGAFDMSLSSRSAPEEQQYLRHHTSILFISWQEWVLPTKACQLKASTSIK